MLNVQLSHKSKKWHYHVTAGPEIVFCKVPFKLLRNIIVTTDAMGT